MHDVLKNPFSMLQLTHNWAKIALSASPFVVSSSLCYMGKFMYACSNFYVVWVDSPFDLW